MPDYGLTARAINQLSRDLREGSRQERADELSMANLGLQRAGMDLQSQNIRGNQAIQLAQVEREKFLNKKVTGRQAIMTNPEWNDQQKQAMLKFFPDDILDGLSFPYKTWSEGLRNALSERQKSAATAKHRSEILGLMRDRIRAQGGKVNTAQQKYTDTVNLQNLMGKYNISEDLSGNLKSPNLTAEDAQALKAEAAQRGLNVYFNKGQAEDTGSGWNPFDNKTVEVYTVRSIAPSGPMMATGLESPYRQAAAQRGSPQRNNPETEAQRIISEALSGKKAFGGQPAPGRATGIEPRQQVQSFEEYAAENPEEASKSGIEALFDRFASQSPEQKQVIRERRKRGARQAFLRPGPVR